MPLSFSCPDRDAVKVKTFPAKVAGENVVLPVSSYRYSERVPEYLQEDVVSDGGVVRLTRLYG